jgi:hypothetical protein
VCGYRYSDRCDCKYGLVDAKYPGAGSEQTGCPELRELINRLLHRPETFITVWDGNDFNPSQHVSSKIIDTPPSSELIAFEDFDTK